MKRKSWRMTKVSKLHPLMYQKITVVTAVVRKANIAIFSVILLHG